MPFRVQKDPQGAWKLISVDPEAAGACGSCRRCSPRELSLFGPLAGEIVEEGTEVELILTPRQVALSLVVAFILPALLGLVFLLAASASGLSEAVALGLGLLGTALGWGLAAVISRWKPLWFQPRWVILSQGEKP